MACCRGLSAPDFALPLESATAVHNTRAREETAGLLLYALQRASFNLRHTDFERVAPPGWSSIRVTSIRPRWGRISGTLPVRRRRRRGRRLGRRARNGDPGCIVWHGRPRPRARQTDLVLWRGHSGSRKHASTGDLVQARRIASASIRASSGPSQPKPGREA